MKFATIALLAATLVSAKTNCGCQPRAKAVQLKEQAAEGIKFGEWKRCQDGANESYKV